ncbi:hypothetical protein [Micromonospora sp. NPDC002717]|uniref:hypothetical protein n=1 Tax=Micromonospora sp. NPDC002717 TaxID=3154424 RepID=UPI003322BE70
MTGTRGAGATCPPGSGGPDPVELRQPSSSHAAALARMRAKLADESQPAPVRALARRPAEDPLIALLDSWAVVSDTVAFYTARIAREGFLRTATEPRSVRELARAFGHELAPGVSAQVELAFDVEDAPGVPAVVTVPPGTPVQTVPRQGQQPQVFETDSTLDAQTVWNEIPAVATEPQRPSFGATELWVSGAAADVRPGDPVLLVADPPVTDGGRPAADADPPQHEVRVVAAVATDPDGHPGWTRLELLPREEPRDDPDDPAPDDPAPAGEATVHVLTENSPLFGWNAPDAALLGGAPADAGNGRRDDSDVFADAADVLELDGDHPRLLPGSLLLLEQPGLRAVYRAVSVVPSAATGYGISGRITRVRITTDDRPPPPFDRRRTLVHYLPVELPARWRPRTVPVAGREVDLVPTDPTPPPGRLVQLRGFDLATGTERVETATILGCEVRPDGRRMSVVFDRELVGTYAPDSVRVLGNVVTADHGETVTQVLGSGDGQSPFAQVATRRGPLTHVRAPTAQGAVSTFTLEVNGVAWTQVPSLATAGPQDRVYLVRENADGTAVVVFGDGVKGARPPTGVENLVATYRVGMGADGAVDAGQVSLLLRRPLGIREVTNPAPSHDWGPPESLADTRRTVPVRTRVLDRAVSVADHADLARGFAGVGGARADLVSDGHRDRIVLSLVGVGAAPVSDGLLADLAAALAGRRPPEPPLLLRCADVVRFGVRVEVQPDPGHRWPVVRDEVAAALRRRFGAAQTDFDAPVTASAVLMVVRAVAGVVACTMPRLVPVGPANPTGTADDVLVPLPAHWDGRQIRPAQLPHLVPEEVRIEAMAR